MEHLAAAISFIVVFVGGGLFYMAIPIIDPTLAVRGISVNEKIRRLELHNRYLQTNQKIKESKNNNKITDLILER